MRVIETTLLSNATMLLSTASDFATEPFFGGARCAPAGRFLAVGLRQGLSTARAALALTALLVGLAALALTARWVGPAALAAAALLVALAARAAAALWVGAVLLAVIILAAYAAAPLVLG